MPTAPASPPSVPRPTRRPGPTPRRNASTSPARSTRSWRSSSRRWPNSSRRPSTRRRQAHGRTEIAVEPLSERQHLRRARSISTTRRASDELKKDAAKIAAIQARMPTEQFLRVLNENPGEVPATFLFYRGDYPAAAARDRPRRPDRLRGRGTKGRHCQARPAPADHRPPAGLRPPPDVGTTPAGGPRAGQSRVAAPFRPRHRRHSVRFRPPGRAADAIPNCSTGWPTSSPRAAGTSSGCSD